MNTPKSRSDVMRWNSFATLGLLLCSVATGCGSDSDPQAAAAQLCNGAEQLCQKRLDEVTFVRTNNGHAARESGFDNVSASQHFGIERQLADGVRAISADAHWSGEKLVLCHTLCALGELDFAVAMGLILTFLEERPGEVLVLDLQNEASSEQLIAGLEATGLGELAHEQKAGTPWPTLGEMITANRRLVILVDEIENPPAWLHRASEFIYSTGYQASSKADLVCDLETTAVTHGLFKLNHTLEDPIATPELAQEANDSAYVTERLTACSNANGHPVNLLSVDYYSEGGVLEAVNQFNARDQQ